MRLVCTCALSIALAVHALAAQVETPGRRLTLEDAIARATEASHRLGELRARHGAATAAAEGRGAARRPMISAQLGYMRTNHVDEFGVRTPDGAFRLLYPDAPDNYRSRIDLQWPIYTGGRLEALERAVRAEAEATGRDLEAARADLRLEVSRSFWAVVTARDSVRVVEQGLARVEAQLRDVRALFETGFVPPNDVLTVDAQRSRQQTLLIEARNQAAFAEATLARLIDAPEGSALDLDASLDDPAAFDVPPFDALVAGARGGRPERAALEHRIDAASERQAAAAAGARPTLAFVSGVDYARPNPRHFPREDVWQESWDVGVAFTWSLWDGGRVRAERAEAAQQSIAARERLSEFDSQLRLEVRQHLLDLEAARAQIATSGDAVRAATEARRVVQERFSAGVATSTELLDAEEVLLRANLERTRALASARLARARLDRAAGR